MLKSIITHKGDTLLMDFPCRRMLMAEHLASIGIKKPAHEIRCADEADEPIKVKIYGTSEFENRLASFVSSENKLSFINTICEIYHNLPYANKVNYLVIILVITAAIIFTAATMIHDGSLNFASVGEESSTPEVNPEDISRTSESEEITSPPSAESTESETEESTKEVMITETTQLEETETSEVTTEPETTEIPEVTEAVETTDIPEATAEETTVEEVTETILPVKETTEVIPEETTAEFKEPTVEPAVTEPEVTIPIPPEKKEPKEEETTTKAENEYKPPETGEEEKEEIYEFSVSGLSVTPSTVYEDESVTVTFRTDSWDLYNAYYNIPVEILYNGRVIYTEFTLLFVIALGYCVIKIFFANIKRGGILLTQIAVGSLYMFSIPKGYTDGFISWMKQVIALCLTAFMQMTLLFLGLLTWQEDMLLGLGVMLAANEVPRIAQNFGLDAIMDCWRLICYQ